MFFPSVSDFEINKTVFQRGRENELNVSHGIVASAVVVVVDVVASAVVVVVDVVAAAGVVVVIFSGFVEDQSFQTVSCFCFSSGFHQLDLS